MLCKFIEITLLHGCSPTNLLHIFRTPFFKKNTSKGLSLSYWSMRKGANFDLKRNIFVNKHVDIPKFPKFYVD